MKHRNKQVLDAMPSTAAFTRKDLQVYFPAMPATTLRSCIRNLCKSGYVFRVDMGVYKRTSKQYKIKHDLPLPDISCWGIAPFSTPHKTAGLGWELHKE